jgi:hypothetical protein
MSVLQCDRRGCENTMCDRLSADFGNICDECFEELVASTQAVNLTTFMSTRVVNLTTFMSTRKRRYTSREAARAYYSEVFNKRHSR